MRSAVQTVDVVGTLWLTREGSATSIHWPGELKDEAHSRQVVVTVSKAVCSARWGWSEEEKTKEHQGQGPICATRETAARATDSVAKEKSRVAVSALGHWAALPGLASELKQGLGSLFYSFSVPQTVSFLESSLFFSWEWNFLKDSVIHLWKRKSVIHIFLCMFTGTKKEENTLPCPLDSCWGDSRLRNNVLMLASESPSLSIRYF